jgi:hypothetical protein
LLGERIRRHDPDVAIDNNDRSLQGIKKFVHPLAGSGHADIQTFAADPMRDVFPRDILFEGFTQLNTAHVTDLSHHGCCSFIYSNL